jgi:hypothetical protein
MYVTNGWNDEHSDSFADFIWSEGNYSCDHNRILFLTDWGARGPDGVREYGDDVDDSVFNCESQRITMERIVDMGGTILYAEGE